MVSGCSHLQSELVSLKSIPVISVRRRRGLAETQSGEILIAYILSFGPVSARRSKS
jgi:hypothetical protein